MINQNHLETLTIRNFEFLKLYSLSRRVKSEYSLYILSTFKYIIAFKNQNPSDTYLCILSHILFIEDFSYSNPSDSSFFFKK